MNRVKQLVLNVDDTEPGRYAKSRTLQLAGFEVIEASNGTDALRLVRERKPDALLLDVQLPDISGLEVCNRVKSDPSFTAIPVLQISASHIRDSDKVKALANGADAYLTEPVDPEVLIATLKSLIRARKAEEALRQLNSRKDSFLTTLSHEIRNTLAPLRSALDLLNNDALPKDQADRSKRIMGRQIGYLTSLIEDLLDIARLNESKISIAQETVNMNTLLTEIAQDYASVWEQSGINFKLDLPQQDINAYVDKSRMQQVISNVLHNANKFTDEGGHISMTMTKDSDRTLRIEVTDDGIGIDKETLPHIFERFTQGDSAYVRTKSGLGLGLSLAHGLIALHQGTIKAESAGVGHGSKFIISLPLSNQTVSQRPVSKVAPTLKKIRVLVVDDNVDAGEAIEMLLQLEGHDVTLVHSAEDAIEAAKRVIPALMICDIGLPGMNGHAVVEKLRTEEALKDTLFAALTGFGSDADKAQSAEAGFHYHLTKPVGLEEVLAIIQSMPSHPKAANS